MFKNSTKMLFLFTLISGSLTTISANSWMSAWMGLEINLLSFIPLMINMNNLMSTEAALKYFLTQALASAMLLFSIIMFMYLTNMLFQMKSLNMYSMLMINSTLFLKIGASPFHFWFPGVMEGLNWTNNLILMTWQKIAPMLLISYNINNNFFIVIIILSIMIGSLGGLNQTSLKKIMAFSSINHLGWMIAAMMINDNLWQMYFFMYSFLSMTLIFMFNSYKLFHINQTFSMFSNNSIMKFFLFMSLLSLGGLPPFLGFMPKWFIIESLTMMNFIPLMIIMVFLTLITLYFYIRICYSAFMLKYWETNWMMKMHQKNFVKIMSLVLAFISFSGLIMINLVFML